MPVLAQQTSITSPYAPLLFWRANTTGLCLSPGAENVERWMEGLIISSRVNDLMAGEVCNCPGLQARIHLGCCCGSYLLACGFSVMPSVH